MYPFEVWDENTHRIEFYHNRWAEYERGLFQQYPLTREHRRVLINLSFPSQRPEDIPIHDWNPHHVMGNYHLTNYDWFYDTYTFNTPDNWSTIFEVYPLHNPHTTAVCTFIEEGHMNPWGERIRIMSTASNIYDNTSHRFAFFRGLYWKVFSWKPYNVIHDWLWQALHRGMSHRWDTFFPERVSEERINWIVEGF